MIESKLGIHKYEDKDDIYSTGEAVNKLRIEVNKIADILDNLYDKISLLERSIIEYSDDRR